MIPKLGMWERRLRGLAALLALAAMVITAIHWITPRLKVSDTILHIARKFLVPPKQLDDFENLAAQNIWHGEQLKTLLEHVELAHYNRQLINWQLDDTVYREHVLSPVIELATDSSNLSTGLHWRRLLWEEFYPRIRHESSPEDAARIVVRRLHERVTITSLPNPPRAVPSIFRNQITDAVGFEIIYVAALRSIGVPARLNSNQQAESWDGTGWHKAPNLKEMNEP